MILYDFEKLMRANARVIDHLLTYLDKLCKVNRVMWIGQKRISLWFDVSFQFRNCDELL